MGKKVQWSSPFFVLFFVFVLLFLFFVFCFFDNKRKIVESNLVLLVVFVPESEGLYYLAVADPGKPLPPPYFTTKLGPEGPKKNLFGDQAPLPLIYGSAWPPHPPPPLISRSASDTVSYNLTCRFQPLHLADVVVQLKYTRIASVSCFP